MRVLLIGWASFLHGEATAGDVLSLRAAGLALTEAGIDHDVAWSPGFRPDARLKRCLSADGRSAVGPPVPSLAALLDELAGQR
jgi:hypothetical protein